MKKLLFILTALILFPASLPAADVSDSQARTIAEQYLRQNAPRRMAGVSQQSARVSLAYTAKTAQAADYYVFNVSGDNGFIVISGEDRATAVLGYTDSGTFDPTNIPDGLRYMLDCYAEQMRYLRSHPSASKAPKRSQYNTAVRPLMRTLWNQDEPYNNLCPTYTASGSTVHAVTGCVATATAQIMYYHKWPLRGTGSHSYSCNVNGGSEKTLSANFGNTTYDWDNMLLSYDDSYTTAEGNAVATLMYHVGVSCDMDYGDSSGASVSTMMNALRTYFGYSNGMHDYKRSQMSISEWETLLVNELDNSRPVLYAGFTPQGGGHAFVCDGYNADGYFHFNWGWGGHSNGYFIVTALSPDDQGIGSFEGGYNVGQEIVTGICPDDGTPLPSPYIELNIESMTPTVSQVNLGSETSIELDMFTVDGYTDGSTYVNLGFGFFLENANGSVVDSKTYNYNLEFGSSYRFTDNYALSYTPKRNLANGNYKLYVKYKVYGVMSNYTYAQFPFNKQPYLDVTVSNNVMYFSAQETIEGTLTVTNLDAPESAPAESDIDITCTFANEGEEYYNNVYFAIYDADSQNFLSYVELQIDVPANGELTVNTMLTLSSDTGDFYLLVLNNDLDIITYVPITVTAAPSGYNLQINQQLAVANYYMEADNISGTAKIRNRGSGAYTGRLRAIVLYDGYVKATFNSPIVTIPAGQTVEVTFTGAYEGLPDTEYQLSLLDPTYSGYRLWGNAAKFKILEQLPTTTLADVLKNGVDGEEYIIANNLTIVDGNGTDLLYVTDALGNWLQIDAGNNYVTVNALDAFKAGTCRGTLSIVNGNPSLTLTSIPVAGTVQPIEIATYDLNETFAPKPCEVLEFVGCYRLENGVPVMRAFGGAVGGQSVTLGLDWLSSPFSFVEGNYYRIHGVAQLKEAWSGAPRRVAADDDLAFQNYVVNLTQSPGIATAVNTVKSAAATVKAQGGMITVEGANRVAVYNATGALVSTAAETELPAGVYLVVADGKAMKVVLK